MKIASRTPTPPGPRGIPILGNALQIPSEYNWLTFTLWAKEYGQYAHMIVCYPRTFHNAGRLGPIMHLSVIGKPMIVLSSREAISDLLEKKNAIYSDRPVVPMAGEL